ncbi:sarcosine oxidase subunit gamma [Aestuariivita boseongensis]|uniref:sarcosine oxidase subunit gamma n=1 Tax=Aestuariivita boseongensis TaxID=1470562 RepID=UPI000680059D|nr:sarcosine oxidase subunit gamma [Aestuariivita boseongensis]
MGDLIAKSACDGLLPLEIGGATLTEIVFDAITSVAPWRGHEQAVSDALKSQMGAAFPAPNRSTGKAKSRAVWSGRGQALVLGPPLEPIAGAAMTDQTDAWACVALEGPAARDVLARLVPIDLRDGSFKRGHAARTQLMHMSIVLMRTGADRYGIMALRSMAGTLVHDLETAMEAVAARG